MESDYWKSARLRLDMLGERGREDELRRRTTQPSPAAAAAVSPTLPRCRRCRYRCGQRLLNVWLSGGLRLRRERRWWGIADRLGHSRTRRVGASRARAWKPR